MKRVAQYDRGIVTRARNTTVARCFSKYIPILILLVVIPLATFFLVTHEPEGSERSNKRSSETAQDKLDSLMLTTNQNIQVQWVGFTWSVGFLVALTLTWTGSYYVAEPGRLTYDRVSTVIYNYVPWTPKGAGISVMLIADLVYVPILLFSHRQVLPGSGIERFANYLLLQNPSPQLNLDAKDVAESGDSSAFLYPAVFWIMLIIAILVFWVGLCCIVPVLAYPSSGSIGGGTPGSGLGSLLGRFTSNRAVIVMGLSSLLGPLVMHIFVRSFPCETAMDRESGMVVKSVMLAWHQVECHSTTHVAYIVLCCLFLFSIGLPLFSSIQQYTNLDPTSFDQMDLHAVKVDPVPLSLITLSRALLVICAGLEMNARIMMAVWMLTQLTAFIAVIFIRFSSCLILNQVARLSTGVGCWSAFWVALLLVTNTYHWDFYKTEVRTSTGSEHQGAQGKYLAVDYNWVSALVTVTFFLGYFGLIIASVVWHGCKRRFQYFDTASEESVLQDLSNNVYL